MRAAAYAKLDLLPWEFGRLSPGELFDMLEAVEEERSQEREWLASLAVTVIRLCTPNKLKQNLSPTDLLSREDQRRARNRTRRAQRVDRKILDERQAALSEGTLPTVQASSDWGPV